MFEGEDCTDWMLLGLFVNEIEKKSNYVLSLFATLNGELESKDSKHVFLLIQAIFLITAQISLSFYPSNRKHKKRGELLAKAFKNSSQAISFLKDRNIRNHIAHMDERLHSWHEESPNKNVVDQLFGPRNKIGGDGITTKDILENYDPEKKIYVFRGDEFDVQKLYSSILEIRKEASIINSNPWWSEEFRARFK